MVRIWLPAVLLAVALSGCGDASGRFITLASTTSTRDSGFFDSVLPRFEARTGIAVRVVAVGAGDVVSPRQQRVEVKQAAELDLVRIGGALLVIVGISDRRRRRYRPGNRAKPFGGWSLHRRSR